MKSQQSRFGKVLAGVAAVALLVGVLVIVWISRGQASPAHAQEGGPVDVLFIKAKPGGLERTSQQPGTLRAFEYQEVTAKVSGFLEITKKADGQPLDIADPVKKGQLLARIRAPELVADEAHAKASLDQAEAQIKQMEARQRAVAADVKAAASVVKQKKAEIDHAKDDLKYREKRYDRLKRLVKGGGVEAVLEDEAWDRMQSARAWLDAAKAGKTAAEAQKEAKEARVEQAAADLKAAKANREVAQAVLDRAREFVKFTEIRSEYNGQLAERNYHDGDYIRSGDQGSQSSQARLFVVQRRDLMRLIIRVPDVEAKNCEAGKPVRFSFVHLDAAENKEFSRGTFRIARAPKWLNEKTRTMRAEVNVPNPKGLLSHGLYADVTIVLNPARKDAIHVPSGALQREGEEEQLKVFLWVVRDGKARRLQVRVGLDNGNEAEILTEEAGGVQAGEQVIDRPSHDLVEGVPVRATEKQSPAPDPAPAPSH